MATPGNEKEWRLNDVEVAAESTEHGQPVATSPLEKVVIENDLEKHLDTDLRAPSNHPQLLRLQSSTSGTTDFTDDVRDAKSQASTKPKKWYKRLNVLKWGKKPPVPETRQVSREFGAGILSLITFQWMAPIMRVSGENLASCLHVANLGRAGRILAHSGSRRYLAG
jgi:hypothetical protein